MDQGAFVVIDPIDSPHSRQLFQFSQSGFRGLDRERIEHHGGAAEALQAQGRQLAFNGGVVLENGRVAGLSQRGGVDHGLGRFRAACARQCFTDAFAR